jgi:LuxR family maltose regulon positive regulatory protein
MEQAIATSGTVYDDTLVYQQGRQEITIVVNSASWFHWLESATSFTFRNSAGNFTAHKERASNRRGSWYWRAYRQRNGKLSRFYLGISARLTLQRLHDAATTLGSTGQIENTNSQEPVHLPPYTLSAATTLPTTETTSPILTTKLQIPRLPVQHIARPHVVALLDQGVQRALTLVCAPAGSGKTTLLAEWASTTRIPVVWLSLEAADNDLKRFLAYLITALARFDPRINSALQQFQPAHAYDYEHVLTNVLNDLTRLLQQDVVVILDDYHILNSEVVQAALQFLTDHLPAHLHLLIGTRVEPPLPLARLRAHSQLSELYTAELRFGSSEIVAFVRSMGLSLSEETNQLLEQYTEGWIAGIQLLVLALRGQVDPPTFLRTFHGTHRFLLDYVSEEILTQQTVEMQHFLLRTSILDRLNGSLCDAITGQTDGSTRLQELLRTNLFVSVLDETNTWYRYHPLFAEALQAHLQKQEPALIPEFYRQASIWYQHHQYREEACEYAFQAGDLQRAADLLTELLTHLSELSKVEQLSRWLSQLPPEIIAASPQLCVASIWMHIMRKRSLANMEEIITYMEGHIQEQTHSAATSWVELQGELTILQAFSAFSQNDLPRTLSLLEGALHLLSTHKTALSDLITFQVQIFLSLVHRAYGNLTTVEQLMLGINIPQPTIYSHKNLIALWIIAKLYEAQGLLQKKEQLFAYHEHAFQQAYENKRPISSLALLYSNRASLYYEWDRLPEASALLQKMHIIAQQSGKLASSTLIMWTLARVALAQGHIEAARQALRQTYSPAPGVILIEREEPPLAAVHARIALAIGDLKEVWHWERTCGRHFNDTPGTSIEGARYFEYMTLARILIARSRIQHMSTESAQALILLRHLHHLVEQIGLAGWLIEIQMLTALALQAQGKVKQALTILGSALTLAEPEGYRRLFIDEGQPMAHLLAHIAPWTTASPGYIQILQTSITTNSANIPETQTNSNYTHQPLLAPLSAREREVLILLAEGLSNQHIADHLIISLNTTKRHVKHLLAKLAVTNRTQAVTRARELNLL